MDREDTGLSMQDILEKVIGCGILLLLVIGLGWKFFLTAFGIFYVIFGM